MILVDSSVWISYFRAEDKPVVHQLRSIKNTTQILVGDLILLEILQGARNEHHASAIEQYLRTFRTVPLLDPHLAARAAGNFRYLRQLGVTVRKTADTIIATFCIENDHELLQQDRDFLPFSTHLGLRLA